MRKLSCFVGSILFLATSAVVAQPEIGESVVLAANSVHFQNGTIVHSGHVLVDEPSAGPVLGCGDAELCLGVASSTPTGYLVAADSVMIQNRAEMQGSLNCTELVDHGAVSGLSCGPISFPVTGFPPFHGPEPTGPGDDIVVLPGESLALPAGDYGSISVGDGAKLHLEGGVYNGEDLTVGDEAAVTFGAPSRIHLTGRLFVGPRSTVGETGGSVAPNQVVLFVQGQNGETGALDDEPASATLEPRAGIAATVYAPNGTIHAKQSAVVVGALLARDVQTGPRSELAHDSYFVARTLDVTKSGDGEGLVTSTPSGIDCGGVCSAGFDNGSTVTLEATPFRGSAFVGWSGDCAGAATTTVEMTSDRSCDAEFAFVDVVTVEMTLDGAGTGRVQTDPTGINCLPTCVTAFPTGTTVYLSATADPGSEFAGWGGDPDCTDGLLSAIADRQCVAFFDEVGQPPENAEVRITKSGGGTGRVESSPPGIDCGSSCSAFFPQGGRVIFDVVPEEGSVFAGWGGDPDCFDGTVEPLPGVTLVECTAFFDVAPPPPPSFRLTVLLLGEGDGSVTSAPPGIVCPSTCAADFPEQGQVDVRLSARPELGSQFEGWGGDCSGSQFFTDIILIGDAICTATFGPGD